MARQSAAARGHVSNQQLIAVILALVAMCAVDMVSARGKFHQIFWNTTNPMFRIDNTDNIIDVNKDVNQREYDQANIICPLYSVGTREADIERYIIYAVTKEEYDNCQIKAQTPRIIAVCNHPHKIMYVTITFRSFTPTPGGLEFLPGKDYYFISTSSRSDLHRRVGGRCSTNNMRLVFKVAGKPPLQGSDHEDLSRHRHTNYFVREKEVSAATSDYLYPTSDIDNELSSNSVEHEKRSEDYASSDAAISAADGAIKQASVMSSAPKSRTILWQAVFMACCSILVSAVSVTFR